MAVFRIVRRSDRLRAPAPDSAHQHRRRSLSSSEEILPPKDAVYFANTIIYFGTGNRPEWRWNAHGRRPPAATTRDQDSLSVLW